MRKSLEMYGPRRKILLFPSWFTEEFVLILPTRGGFIDSMGKVFFTTLGEIALCLKPTGKSFYVDDLNSLVNLCWFYP